MRLKCILATFAMLSLLSSISASAQSVPAAASSSQTAPTVVAPVTDTVIVPMWPTAAITLPESQPVAASFSLGSIEGVDPHLLTGVTAKGYARKVAVDNDIFGQVLVVSVAKGDREEAISTAGLTAQFDASETSDLFPEKTVEVQGSKAALVAALERLAQAKPNDDEKTAATDDVSENPVSGGAPSNDEASSYKTPTISATPAQEDDPVTEVRTSSDGCSVRIDMAQGKAVRQSKTQTFTDGVLSGEGQCSDSEMGFLLKQSYSSCPTDIVDLEGKTAWPQFSWYYIDDAGENHPVGECVKDEETSFTITEDENQCPIFLDFNAEQAVPQSALVYIGRNNALTQVPGHGCGASTTSPPLPMTESTANCPLRHDYGPGLSAELSMWTYIRGGVTYQAAPCADNGRTFTHEKVYADTSGGYVCPPITNLDAKTVTLQSRKRITIDGVPQFITECTPDTSTQAILATTDGCMDPSKWTHDLDTKVSYGQERFYYTKANGAREYVTACQTSSVTYPHDVTITGYQNHDAELWAYPLSTVKITVGGTPYTIASSTVLPGATQWSYVLDGTYDGKTGESTYEGCNAYRLTARFERWKRPDDTEYAKAIGTGTPEGPVPVCVDTVIKSAEVETFRYCSLAAPIPDGISYPYSWGSRFTLINKTQKKNTETGDIIATTCAGQSSRDAGSGTLGGWTYVLCSEGTTGVPSSYKVSTLNSSGLPGTWWRLPTSNSTISPTYSTHYGTTCPSGF